MYTIKQAASRSGVAVNTIRAWERRYGVVAPDRTASGYRLYDDEHIRHLDAMRRMVASGIPPSIAAAELRQNGLDAAPPEAAPRDASAGSAVGLPAGQDQSERLVERFVAGAASLDEGAITAVLDELFARGSFEHVVSDLLFPALEGLGEAWAAGRVSVAGEHLASHLVQRRLGQILDAAGTAPAARRRVIVGLPPGSRHELGALAFAIVARRMGLPVVYLGADLPVDDWLAASKSARAAVIAVPTVGDRDAAAEVVAALVADAPNIEVAVGGDGAADLAGAVRLPDRLDDAVATLKRTLAAR